MNKVFKYDQNCWPFKNLIFSLFDNHPLNMLHTKLKQDYRMFDKPSKDSDTIYHKIFYDRMRTGWEEFLYTYKNFINNFVQEQIGESIIYQKWPTFRVHLPDNLAVGAWHTDYEYNHPEGEINFVIAITEMFESNTFITESQPGLRDFKQVELNPGELFMFNGNKCLHGNLPNRTGKTRVSLDFRIMKKSDYKDNNKTSITTGTKFKLGEYYE